MIYPMLQAEKRDTYALATNRTETMRDFVNMAIKAAGFDLVFAGTDANESSIDCKMDKTLVKVNLKFYRPAEVDSLIGNPEKDRRGFRWEPNTTLEQFCKIIIEADLWRTKRGVSL